MRDLEDRLSDTLHERLMQRFIDRRTSVLMRALHVRDEVLAGVADDGTVTVEGHYVGKLRGLHFAPAQGATQLEDKTLREAARRAVGPEIARRLGQLAAAPDSEFGVLPDGTVTWRGQSAGKLAGGRPLAPRVRLLGEMGTEPARERAARRLEAFIAAEVARRLAPLQRLEGALAEGTLKGLARGITYQLVEAGGVLDRRAVAGELKALSHAERRALRSLGVRIGAFSLWLPGLLKPKSRALACALTAEEAGGWRAPSDKLSVLPTPLPAPRALAARGLRAVGGLAVPTEALERLDALLRAAPKSGQGAVLSDQAREELGWTPEEAARILKGLGFTSARKKGDADQPAVWRARRPTPEGKPSRPTPDSPFAALAALKPSPELRRRPRKRRPAKPVRSA
jgi:ATP-dependent RNA helicase SUPV3L1/SUV3